MFHSTSRRKLCRWNVLESKKAVPTFWIKFAFEISMLLRATVMNSNKKKKFVWFQYRYFKSISQHFFWLFLSVFGECDKAASKYDRNSLELIVILEWCNALSLEHLFHVDFRIRCLRFERLQHKTFILFIRDTNKSIIQEVAVVHFSIANVTVLNDR